MDIAWRVPPDAVAVSVVVPACNERACIGPLLREIGSVLGPVCRFEVVCVDDGSTDGTGQELAGVARTMPELVVVRHARTLGQSAALVSGVQAARAPWVATLDGDGQNVPADILRLLAERDRYVDPPRLLAGCRVQRRDAWSRRIASRLANAVRRRLLRDGSVDSCCGTRLFERDAFLALPRFEHMHRFLPALFLRQGCRIASVAVAHRPRLAGRSKYGNLQRLRAGVLDLVGVWWLCRRPLPLLEARGEPLAVHGGSETAAVPGANPAD